MTEFETSVVLDGYLHGIDEIRAGVVGLDRFRSELTLLRNECDDSGIVIFLIPSEVGHYGHLLSYLDMGELGGCEVAAEIDMVEVGEFEEGFAGSGVFSGFGVFDKYGAGDRGVKCAF